MSAFVLDSKPPQEIPLNDSQLYRRHKERCPCVKLYASLLKVFAVLVGVFGVGAAGFLMIMQGGSNVLAFFTAVGWMISAALSAMGLFALSELLVLAVDAADDIRAIKERGTAA